MPPRRITWRSNGAIWTNPPAKSTSPSRWNRRRPAFGSRARSRRNRGVSAFPSGRSRCCARIAQEQARDRQLFGADYEDHNLVFCQPNGAYYSPDRLGARVVELMRKVGLRGVSLHSLRHSHASSLLSNGVPIAVVSERLGHSRPEHHAVDLLPRACQPTRRPPRGSGTTPWRTLFARSRAKKPDAERTLANVCTREGEISEVFETKRKRMAGTTGLEPATSDVTGRRSNQLNYVPALCRVSDKNSTQQLGNSLFRSRRVPRAITCPDYNSRAGL